VKIYFHLSGRLGNQLFQWAYLHELANQGHEIHLFTDRFHNDIRQDTDLNLLIAKCPHLNASTVRNDLGIILKIREKMMSRGKGIRSLAKILPILIEGSPSSKGGRFSILIDGYFINKEWPIKYRDILCKEFSNLQKEISSQSSHAQELFLDTTKTTIHVRRGDLHDYKDTFGLLSRDYFSPLFSGEDRNLVVSDSMDEAKQMFVDEKKCYFVDPSDDEVWKVLMLMSTSARVIMSNSTLSWWGGFFAANTNNATVYMPRPFYRDLSKFDELLHVDQFITVDSIFE
jgi:hypothetical protein